MQNFTHQCAVACSLCSAVSCSSSYAVCPLICTPDILYLLFTRVCPHSLISRNVSGMHTCHFSCTQISHCACLVVRIDLGTTNSCVSVWRARTSHVFENSEGARTTSLLSSSPSTESVLLTFLLSDGLLQTHKTPSLPSSI